MGLRSWDWRVVTKGLGLNVCDWRYRHGRLKGYTLTLGTEREGSQLKGWHWTVVTKGLQQQTGCNWRVATKGFGLRFWDRSFARLTAAFDWRVGTDWLSTKGCNRRVATEVLQTKTWGGRLGAEVLQLKASNWKLVAERLWLKAQASGNWSFVTERLGLQVKGRDWRVTTKGLEMEGLQLKAWDLMAMKS